MIFRSKYKVTQKFGVNKEYYSRYSLLGHEGLDVIPTGSNWTVLALADGKVVKDIDNPRSSVYGNYVTLWHPQVKRATSYAHLAENYVILGESVKRGQPIGKMGNTGNSSGAHVHLNLFKVDNNGIRLNRDNGYAGGIDPLPFLENMSSAQPSSDCLVPNTPEWQAKYEEIISKATKYDEMSKEGYTDLEKINATISKLETDNKSKDDTILNLNKLVKEKNSENIALNKSILLKEGTIEDLEMRNESLEATGKDVVQYKKEVDELLRQREAWIDEEKIFNQRIGQLKASNKQLREKAFTELLQAIWDNLISWFKSLKNTKQIKH